MARKTDSGSTPATTALARAGIEFTVHAYEHDPRSTSYGQEAAEALGVPSQQVFKTLLVHTDRGLGVGIVPVDRSLDLKALAAALMSKRASMADPRAAERATGYVLGGISPVGQRTALPTVLDATAERFDRVYVSGGKRGLDIALSPRDLLQVTGGSVARISR